MTEVLRREAVYLWYYFFQQLSQILPYWIAGMLLGSLVSVFIKEKIHRMFRSLGEKRLRLFGIVIASLLGIASPLCMYGTIPIAASFSKSGINDDLLAAFMMSSVLLNPQLILYSAALGGTVLAVRIISCFLCGVIAGLAVRFFFKSKPFFNFSGFEEPISHDIHANPFIRYLKNIGRNIRATGIYFLVGVFLSALFQRYVPSDFIASLFGDNRGFGVLMAATIGVPLYACGGGTIPLLQTWLSNGMSIGSATAFMLTGPATKITNLGALKIVLGMRNFVLYLVFCAVFAFISGLAVNLIQL